MEKIVAVTVRYFGGIKLGAGGLVRAYSESLKDAISKSTFLNESEVFVYSFKVSYSDEMKLLSFLRDNNFSVVEKDYSDKVYISFAVLNDDSFDIMSDIMDITSGKAEFVDKQKKRIQI